MTLETYLAGLSTVADIKWLGIWLERCKWDSGLPNRKQYKNLSQKTTLIESLKVVENESVALEIWDGNDRKMSYDDHDIKIRNQIDMVVLNYECDAKDRPDELQRRMAHRGYLAL